MKPPVIVVGAGHNGLICAIRLAEAGLPVMVLEAADRPGGSVSSSPATLPGFLHDDCSGFFPMTLAAPAFAGLRERIQWVNPEVAMAHPFADGSAIALHRDLDATAESLEATAPGAGGSWRNLLRPLLDQRRRIFRAAFTDSFPPVRDGVALAAPLRRDALELARLMLASPASFGRELFGNDRATAWFSGSALHADLTPGSAGASALAFGLKFMAHAVGWGYPRGGAGQITAMLVDRLEELGGRVRCGSPVERVLVSAGTVRGLRLPGGEEVPARAVVLALSAAPAHALLPADALPGRLMRRLHTWRYGLGTVKADFALSRPVPWSSPVARDAAVVHVGGELPTLFAAHQQAAAGALPEEPVLVVGQHTLHDPTRAPAGHHTLYAYTHAPASGGFSREEAGERIEGRIEGFAPGFRELVLARTVRLPSDLQRENRSLVGGDLAGGSCELDQQLIFRPALELFRGRTPLRGLYLAGPSIHPGPGVNGVSGAAAARALIADQGPLRRAMRRLKPRRPATSAPLPGSAGSPRASPSGARAAARDRTGAPGAARLAAPGARNARS
jgi:phytoene dehydrogenase-like protein